MADDGVPRETEPQVGRRAARDGARLRARVVAWPGPAFAGGDDVYGVKLGGLGADAAPFGTLARGAGLWVTRDDRGAVVVSGPLSALRALAERAGQHRAAAAVAGALERFRTPPAAVEARRHVLSLSAGPLIVGVLNATPDSFYDRGRYFARDAAIARADEMVAEGADVVEVGGESARPGEPVGEDEEVRRVVPLIGALAGRLPVPIAVDTYAPGVARRAVDAGAVLINDISGLADTRMADVAAESGAALVVMHIQGRPKVRQPRPRYEAVVDEVYAFLEDRTELARAAGVPRARLIVDPGFSFGKAPGHDLELLRRLGELRGLGYPIYLATSRKNYIRDVLGLPFEELLAGTSAAIAYGVAQGAHLVRTHDVRFMKRVAAMARAITGPAAARDGDAPPRRAESAHGRERDETSSSNDRRS